MISNSFGEEFGWQARKLSARNPTDRLNDFRRVPARGALPKVRISRRVALSGLAGCEVRKSLLKAQLHQALLSERPSQSAPKFLSKKSARPPWPVRKQGLVELGLKERFSCFAASQAAQRNSPRLLAEILTFGRAPRGGTRRKLLSLPVGFLAESFLACRLPAKFLAEKIADHCRSGACVPH